MAEKRFTLTYKEYLDFNQERQRMEMAKLFIVPAFETPVFDRVNGFLDASSPSLMISMIPDEGKVVIIEGRG